MYLRNKPQYRSYSDLWENGYQSPFFQVKYDQSSDCVDLSLSERQLMVQSNGKTMLGQDAKGRLQFICSPHEQAYPVPSGGPYIGGQFRGHIGQYYQTDVALFLGKMHYELELNNGLIIDAAGEDAISYYLDHFLPVAKTTHKNIETNTFSLAPILEMESVKTSDIHPLPGPSCAIYGISVKNTGNVPIRGKIHLKFDQKFLNQFEAYGKRFEDFSNDPFVAEWDQKLLILWNPEGCATIQFMDAIREGNPRDPQIYQYIDLKPGETRTFTSIISVTPERKQAYAALGTIYRHTALEWINITQEFWQKRLGKLEIKIDGDPCIGQKYRDMHFRFILDNFNCLQFDSSGNMIMSWQGAPSHALGRSWGIDIEPNVFAVLWAIPEIGRSAAKFAAKFSLPGYSIYSDHSMLIALAPLTIAGKYLDLTNDVKFFIKNDNFMKSLNDLYEYILAHKHPDVCLFSSRYASDLIVFKKYDYGTNVKCIYALNYYANIMESLGLDGSGPRKLAKQTTLDLKKYMEADGPFGNQITGGTNLSLNDNFYIPEEVLYYGGEDTTSSLAPVYGLYPFDYAPYVNLNRFARSLFISNYDPEYQTMRELHYGMNPSATGITLKLGGSVTPAEMRDSLNLLFERLDESASLYWWPRASNKKRCLTRCSQGQGAWVQHSIEQWLGLRMNSEQRSLTIQPQGLINDFTLKAGRIGNFVFDIAWHESSDSSEFEVRNLNDTPFKIRFGARKVNAGATGELQWFEEEVGPGETVKHCFTITKSHNIDVDIHQLEMELLSSDGVIFAPYGVILPKLFSQNCSIFLLRYALVNATNKIWENVDVDIKVPEGWHISEKEFYIWDYNPKFESNTTSIRFDSIEPGKHYVAPFYVAMPDSLSGGEKSVMLSKHAFDYSNGTDNDSLYLMIEAKQSVYVNESICAKIKFEEKEVIHELPIYQLSTEEYSEKYRQMLHGKNEV